MLFHFINKILIVILMTAFILPSFFIFTLLNNNKEERKEFIIFAQYDTPEQERAALEKELKELEELEKKISQDITKTQKEKNSLSKEISTLKSRMQQLDVQIKKNNIVIKNLGIQIEDTEGSIDKTSFKIEDSKKNLSNVLQTLYEEDQKSLIEVLLIEKDLSDFFDNITYLEALNQKNQELLKNIKNLKFDLENQKNTLDGEKDNLENTVKLQSLQKQQSIDTKTQQEVLLKQTQGKESEYQKILQDTQKRSAEIRAKIFQLAGIADTDAPTFGEALELAKWVQQMTGVRPAFLLSIITQESALGRNVGQCYIANTTSGASVGIKTGKIFKNGIHATRDLPKLIQITQELGKDPLKTPISCPLSYGYGGAMGPAQFIPSTWLLVQSKVIAILGHKPNPWSIKDSFLSAGVLLRENGAATSELRAAARYFGTANLGYESTVMQRTACIQIFIDQGTLTYSCEKLVFIP